MSYTKTQWNNDTAPAINETNLNKIEQGIYDNDSHIGDLSDLETTANADLVSAINENVSSIGDLSDLETTAQTDIVSAINENVDNIGDLTTLTTTANTDLVSAINEVDGNTDINTAKLNGTQVAGDMVVDSIKTKNLCNISSSGMFPNTSGTVTVGNCYSAVIDVSNMSSVYVSGNFNLLGDTLLRIGKYSSYPKQGSTGTRMSMSSSGAIDVSNVNYLLFSFAPASSATLDQIKNSFMIEEGTSATTFKPCQDLDAVSNNYSTLETKIGTWIDGKPIYRKVIPFTRNTSANSTNITHNISNLGDVVNCYGYFKDGAVTRLIPQFYYADMTTYSISIYTIDATRVALFYGDWYRYATTITNSYIVLEYTKTTD